MALLAVLAFDRGAGFVCVVCVGLIYMADTAFTLARRVANGEDWWSPHRQHTYQRLTATGLSHVSVALIVAAFSATAAGLGLLSIDRSAVVSVLALLGALAGCALYLAMPTIVGRAHPHP
jgi:hypothetical protein